MEIKRGQIYWINPSKYRDTIGSVQAPNRPGIIVSNDTGNYHGYTYEVVYLTTAPKKDYPTHVLINSSSAPSTAICEQVTTVSSEQIGHFIGTCTEEEMHEINRCIAISLGLNIEESYEIEEGECEGCETLDELKEEIETLRKQLIQREAKENLLQEMYNNLLKKLMD